MTLSVAPPCTIPGQAILVGCGLAAGQEVQLPAGWVAVPLTDGERIALPSGRRVFFIHLSAGDQLESIRAARESRAVHDLEDAQAIQAKLQAEPINVPVRAGDGGRLFGAVTVAAIAEALDAAAGTNVDKRRIDVGQPIKSLGSHQVTVRVHPEVTAQVKLNVVASK